MSIVSGDKYPLRRISDFTEGFKLEREFSFRLQDVEAFASASSDFHPLHVNVDFARARGFPDIVVHGMLVLSRVSAFVAYEFVGSHGLLLSVSSEFRQPIFCGDSLRWIATIKSVSMQSFVAEINWKVVNSRGATFQVGNACILFPKK